MTEDAGTVVVEPGELPAGAEGTNGEGPTPAVKRAPIIRVTHPALQPDAEGKPTVKLTAWPADHSTVKHKALRPDDFVTEALWYREQAKKLRAEADELDQQALECETLGSKEDRKNVEKLRKLSAHILTLRASLVPKIGEEAVEAIIKQLMDAATADLPAATVDAAAQPAATA